MTDSGAFTKRIKSMAIIIPKEYHLRKTLESRRVLCIDQGQALKEDIRPLRIGILNIMPKAETYELSLLYPLGRSILQIEPIWIRLKTHKYGSSDSAHLEKLYISFEEAVKNAPLDGLVVTGAPVEEIPFEDVSYWKEITEILFYAKLQIPSTLGICWGGLALAKILGIEKILLPSKLFGVFETRNLNLQHPITGDMDDIFWCPQSRHSAIADRIMEQEASKGKINLLAHSKEAGYTIFESSDHRFLGHLGHPEYDVQRLIDEYHRDLKAGRRDVCLPANLDLTNPLNRWKCSRDEFFSQWIRSIHSAIAFQNVLDYCI
jgi:homoserine O-succinyltransferase